MNINMLILITALCDRNYHLHFADEKTKKLSKLPKFREPVLYLGIFETFALALFSMFLPSIIIGMNIDYGFWNPIFLLEVCNCS